MEYFAANLISPVKSAILMYFIYRGLLHGTQSLGILDRSNFTLYVLLGTTCHSLFMACVYIFRSRMVTEKWWQTVTATLISPATTLELIAGFMVGSGALNLVISFSIFGLLALFFPVTLPAFLTSVLILFILALLGFGVGLLGATVALCWEGKSFLLDYGIQALIFLSCFYYPIETLPHPIHGFIKLLPTYHASQLIQQLFLVGSSSQSQTVLSFTYVTISSIIILLLPAFFFNYSVKRYGIVGY